MISIVKKCAACFFALSLSMTSFAGEDHGGHQKQACDCACESCEHDCSCECTDCTCCDDAASTPCTGEDTCTHENCDHNKHAQHSK